ncbi:hypothetical protein ZIOFF_060318 [Zingiber officinale]|uniref:Uncharacterized protein n=1 Tax=Zingiber officinale TaxID=94328 RepID=A0A8J5ELJ7_ZINOF|nr:hypothetical protein ZIOFF_075487 [Zingiber officinale]KAG6467668.1 hypothetical protein ZIOFF_074463 [Zingiber officinale]KAG6483666.1 hypothetical protein ZIOFF_060318 [Zingiber officinale]
MARPRALGGRSLLFCSRHEKDARKRIAQRVEDPLRVSVVSVLGSTSLRGPCFYKVPRGQFLCSVCPPFLECPARFTGLLAYPSCRPPSGLRARYPYCSLCWAPSNCSSHKLCPARTHPPILARLFAPDVRGSFAFAGSIEILRVLRPRFPRRGHLVHRYYQRVSCLRYCD